MTRHLRLLGLLSIATLALFVTPAVVVAQTPVQDQYEPAPDADTDPGDDTGAADTDPDAAGGDQAPVAVQEADADGALAFTGGSVPLIALIGLALLAVGLVGAAASRKRRASGSP
ncbi:MAG: hypothetical protein ACRDLS_01235 [Solirubrobacteraceae bacterium]